MKSLYPPLEPYAVHRMPVDHGHLLYVEECGNPSGLPVLFLHGGPGSGCKPQHRAFFDPLRYRAILLDQRGAGRSTPQGGLRANTTQHLLDDMEKLRLHLQVERWLLFGGSWGAALALAYAQKHPDCVHGLILRGSFLARRRDLAWFLADGAGRIYPEAWQRLLDFLPPQGRRTPLKALYAMVASKDQLAQRRAARAWLQWSDLVTLGEGGQGGPSSAEHVTLEQLHKTQIELHYAVHRHFLADQPLLDGCSAIAHLPGIVIHGRDDRVCAPEAAFLLHRALPNSELHVLPGVSHVADGEAMIDALVDAADRMAERLAP